MHQSFKKEAKRMSQTQIERELRTIKIRYETLREQNSILKSRIRALEVRETPVAALGNETIETGSTATGAEGTVTQDPLSAFAPARGVSSASTSISPSISPGTVRREAASTAPVRSFVPHSVADSVPTRKNRNQMRSDTVDHVLYRAILRDLKDGDRNQALRNLGLLSKSYPESDRIPEAYFQIALTDFRAGRVKESEQAFRSVLEFNSRTQLKAGALLMIGIFARNKAPNEAKQNFNWVVQNYPGTPEARRAKIELRSIDRVSESRSSEKRKRT